MHAIPERMLLCRKKLAHEAAAKRETRNCLHSHNNGSGSSSSGGGGNNNHVMTPIESHF
jgi:hypothetical protein